MRWMALAGALALCAPAFAASKTTARDPRVVGLGRRCDKRKDCQGKGQVCLHPTDARGKLQQHGFCALPCASFESGLRKPPPPKAAAREPARSDGGTPQVGTSADAGMAVPTDAADAGPARVAAAPSKRKPKKVPPRCPPHFQCRSAGAGVPIDLCVRD